MMIFASLIHAQSILDEIQKLIDNGEFTSARNAIKVELESNSDETTNYDMKFKLDLMDRIEIDFNKREADIIKYIIKYFPEVDSERLRIWETSGKLEYKIINGERRYFRNAAPNLFRVDDECKKRKEEVDGIQRSKLELFLFDELPNVVSASVKSSQRFVKRGKIKINYSVLLPANTIPEGEILRCWLPFPKETSARQKNINLISAFPTAYIIAPDSQPQRSIYFEQKTIKGAETRFNIELSYDAYSEYYHNLFDLDLSVDNSSDIYKEYTSERKPHINFSDELKQLSQKIVGSENNIKAKFKKIYEWISEEVPWASALEYSTINSISNYCIEKGYGDCGIKSLLFITLCRYNGIPAKWQSGWMFQPGSVNLHDWSQIYFDQTGWITVDSDYGLQPSDDENVNWFFAKGVDAFHFIVNEDYGQEFFPTKIFPRSETVDFQRGELEWRGGNLYFDKWDYNMKVEYFFDNH